MAEPLSSADRTGDEGRSRPPSDTLTAAAVGSRRDQDVFRHIKRLAVAGIALALVAGIVAFFTVDVCDQQLSGGGEAVKVCRHLQSSDPPVIGVGVVLLAALGFFFTEISGFGFSLKREVNAVKETARAATDLGARNSDKLDETAGDLADLGRAVVHDGNVLKGIRVEEDHPDLRALAEEYNQIRFTMPSGNKRTAAMQSVVTRMFSVLTGVKDFDVRRHLDSPNGGLRLAGFAYLYTYPDPRWTSNLVESLIEREDKPFGQWWALSALRKQCETDRLAISPEARRRLAETFQTKVPTGSDRAMALRDVLDACTP